MGRLVSLSQLTEYAIVVCVGWKRALMNQIVAFELVDLVRGALADGKLRFWQWSERRYLTKRLATGEGCNLRRQDAVPLSRGCTWFEITIRDVQNFFLVFVFVKPGTGVVGVRVMEDRQQCACGWLTSRCMKRGMVSCREIVYGKVKV